MFSVHCRNSCQISRLRIDEGPLLYRWPDEFQSGSTGQSDNESPDKTENQIQRDIGAGRLERGPSRFSDLDIDDSLLIKRLGDAAFLTFFRIELVGVISEISFAIKPALFVATLSQIVNLFTGL